MNSRINQQGDQVSPKEIHELHKDFLALGGEGEAISRDQFNKVRQQALSQIVGKILRSHRSNRC